MFLLLISIIGCNKKTEKTNTSSEKTTSGIIQADDNDASSDTQSFSSDNSTSDSMESSAQSGSENKNTASDNNSLNGNGDNNSSQSNNQLNNSSSDSNADKALYKDIICRSIPENGWKTVELVSKVDNSCITISIPKSWEIKDGKILDNDTLIGEITTKAPDKSEKSYEIYSSNTGITVFRRSIEEYLNQGKTEYKRLFKVSKFTETVGSNILYILVDYDRLDNTAAAKIISSFDYLGSDRVMPEIKNDSKVFLILGNDFLNTSKIAEFLSDMLITDGSNFTVEIRIKDTIFDFASDKNLIAEIENGNFAYIFQCGFYNTSEQAITVTKALKTIIDASYKSNTAVVALPAHNEPNVEINNVLSAFSELYCINWKEEINSLIESGISYTTLTETDFCQNDKNKHSTPLAGYVGAHMIYRNIFGKIPPTLTNSAPLDMATINSKLLSYPLTGIVPGKTMISKYYIS